MYDIAKETFAGGEVPKLELLPEDFDLMVKLLEAHKHETQYQDLWTKMIWMRLNHAVVSAEGAT